MLCEICGKLEAQVHLTDVVDGQKKTLVLCEGCASEKGFVIDPGLIQAAAKQLKKILEPETLGEALGEAAAPKCPHCGIMWKEFRKSSRFGCPFDYEFFGKEVERLVKKIHGHSAHRGRVPGPSTAQNTRNRALHRLRVDLDSAIRQEEYERAAEIRDQIRTAEREGEGDRGAV